MENSSFYKINGKFYSTLEDFFNSIGAVESERMVQTMKMENAIISVINLANTKKSDQFRSDVPKILSANFQLFEAALGIIQSHPCYLQKVFKYYNNKKNYT